MRSMDKTPLAVVVAKLDADDVITALKQEGRYDSDRRIVEHDADHLELPVAAPPDETSVRDLIEQPDPPWRVRDLADRLRARGWSPAEIDAVPRSWGVIGSIIVGKFADCPRPHIVGEELLALHGNAHTVLSIEGIGGAHRIPDVSVVAGEGKTNTVHVEHGTEYAMDLSEVMFSPGNQAERVRMGELVGSGETVFDMFAGIGYFALPVARAGASVTATERNPTAFTYLQENVERNDVSDLVTPVLGDCRDADVTADHIIMGHYDALAYLESAITAVRPGGILHVHDVAPANDPFADIEQALDELLAGGVSRTTLHRQVVKSHSPGLEHVVIDVQIG